MANRLLVCIGASLLAVILVASTSNADDVELKTRFSGTTAEIAIDINDDGLTATRGDFQAKGTFGRSVMACVTEWEVPADEPPFPCPPEFFVKLTLVHAATAPPGTFQQSCVATFEDQSQLVSLASGGGMCLNPFTGEAGGQITGTYSGGTGRFEDATGTYVTTFSAAQVMWEVGFSLVYGESVGTINLDGAP